MRVPSIGSRWHKQIPTSNLQPDGVYLWLKKRSDWADRRDSHTAHFEPSLGIWEWVVGS
jgi:hypothetical protein